MVRDNIDETFQQFLYIDKRNVTQSYIKEKYFVEFIELL